MQTEELSPIADFGDIRVVQVGLESIINTFEREDLMMLVAYHAELPVGFKIGYKENRFLFYSAKGGVIDGYRGQGIAQLLLDEMIARASSWGFKRIAYDTFPNMHVGMTVLGLRKGFRVVKADFNTAYNDFRLRLEKAI